MGNAVALESITTGDPGASGEKVANISSQEDGTIEIVGGFALSDRIPSSLAPDVDTLTATTQVPANSDLSDATWVGSSGANLKAINNRGALSIWCHFEGATDSATLRVAYYDAADEPLFVGPALAFVPTAYILDVADTPDMYVSEPQLVETYGASQYRIMVTAYSGTNDLDVYSQPL